MYCNENPEENILFLNVTMQTKIYNKKILKQALYSSHKIYVAILFILIVGQNTLLPFFSQIYQHI